MPEFDVGGFIADDPLVLNDVVSKKYPKGKTYIAPDLPYRDALQFKKIMALPQDKVNAALVEFCRDAKGNEISPAERLLGPAFDLMLADGVPRPVMERVETLAIVYYSTNEEVTRTSLSAIGGPVGEAQARTNRATRRAATKATSRSAAGSKSGRASTATPARPRSRASGPSSTSPTARKARRTA